MCIETHPCLFSFLDTIIVLFQSRPRNLPRTTLFRDILNPCSVNGDIMDSRLQRRILNILLHQGVADEIRCPLGPGIEFDAHQGCRNIILKTIIARSGSINQPLLIYRSMREKKKKKKMHTPAVHGRERHPSPSPCQNALPTRAVSATCTMARALCAHRTAWFNINPLINEY